jgi:RHS repeat-associated protein
MIDIGSCLVSGDTTATFTFNGDGQRVKSVMDGETTLFVGGHYEIANPGAGQTVTKYYMAGATRVAVRKDGTLSYMLADHLGSTSLVTDTNGNRTSELRYKPWGETRFSFGTMPTKYTFTGQFSYTDDPSTPESEGFGLMYYGARWYDNTISRFAQADTVIPSGAQGLDRYAYVNNNPVVYRDPTGHMIDQGAGGCTSSIDCANISTVQRIQAYLGGRNPNVAAAIKLAIIYYNIDTHGASVTYDENLTGASGQIDDSGNIVIGPSALRSAGFLGATIFHESVHVEQAEEGRDYDPEGEGDAFGIMGQNLNEVEAYDRELAEAEERFGLTEDEISDLEGNRNTYFARIRWNPILEQRVEDGNYTLTGIPEICLSNPSDISCYDYLPENSP